MPADRIWTRRDALRSAAAVAAAGLGGAALAAPTRLARLGATTVSFRDRFPVRLPGAPPPPPGQSLLTAPAFVRDALGLTNLEVWNLQFEDDSDDYCDRLRSAAAAAGGRIINVQLDGAYDLSSDDAARRAQGLAFVKGWMDRARRLGSPTLRANFSGLSPKGEFPLGRVVEAFRELAAHGRRVGVKILCENHIGFSVPVDNVVAVLKAVDDPWCRTILDWGNSPARDQAEREAQVAKLAPWLALVSAKGVHFGPDGRHLDYDVAALTRATERTGYRGLYSIELFATENPPQNPVLAARSMVQVIAANLRA